MAQAYITHAPTGPQEWQKLPITARKRASKASFAIREPQPAGLSLKASLQQLRGTTNTSQAPGGREKPAEDAIMSNAGEERQPQSRLLPSPSQALLQTLTPIPGTGPMGASPHLCMSSCYTNLPGLPAILKESLCTDLGLFMTHYTGLSCAGMSAGDTREPSKAGAGMSAQRSFLASVLKPGKRQNFGSSQQVVPSTSQTLQTQCFVEQKHCLQSDHRLILPYLCVVLHKRLPCRGIGGEAHRTCRHEWATDRAPSQRTA